MRKGYFVCLIVLLAGLVVFSTADSEAQGRRGGGPGGVDTEQDGQRCRPARMMTSN